MPTAKPAHSSRRFLLQLEGGSPRAIRAIEGGHPVAEVIEMHSGGEAISAKFLGRVRLEELAVETGLDMDKSMASWISAMWAGDAERRAGAVLAVDVTNKVVESRTFSEALLTEVTVPALDGAAKEAAFLTVKFMPETVASGRPSGQVAPAKARTKAWLASNFRLEIDGLDCKRVAKIDSFTIRQSLLENLSADGRTLTHVPGRVQFPNLKITLAGTGYDKESQSWTTWFEDFVVKGNHASSHEKNGAIVFLAPDLKSELGRINLFSLGIYRLAPQHNESGSDRLPRFEAGLYCERMELKLGLAATGAPQSSVAVPPARRSTTLTVPRPARPG